MIFQTIFVGLVLALSMPLPPSVFIPSFKIGSIKVEPDFSGKMAIGIKFGLAL